MWKSALHKAPLILLFSLSVCPRAGTSASYRGHAEEPDDQYDQCSQFTPGGCRGPHREPFPEDRGAGRYVSTLISSLSEAEQQPFSAIFSRWSILRECFHTLCQWQTSKSWNQSNYFPYCLPSEARPKITAFIRLHLRPAVGPRRVHTRGCLPHWK